MSINGERVKWRHLYYSVVKNNFQDLVKQKSMSNNPYG